MALNTWQTVFRPEFTHGGIDSLTRGVVARSFDDFEYVSDGALQAIWTGTNITATRTSTANAIRGMRSMEIAVAGGTGDVGRAINNAIFNYPTPGRIRYVAFKAIVTSGSSTIRVRLSDASDATLYREWQFTVSTDESRDFIIDLYSGSGGGVISEGGFQNTESNPGPVAEGATEWDSNLVDQLEFRNLTDTLTFRFDDLRFFYEYSMLDAIGFGTEPATADGIDGSLHSKIRLINNSILQLVGSTEQYSKLGPGRDVFLNNSYTFGLELMGVAEEGIPSTTEIDPGNYVIERIRNGTTTEIVASSAASESNGFISAVYTPLEDNWTQGDQLFVTFSGGSVYNDTGVVKTPDNVAAAQAVVTFSTSGDAFTFQVGDRVRLYDDDASEWNVVLTVDSPTQLTLTNNAANLYDANPRIVKVERTELQAARIATNVGFEEEIQRELQRWVLADYDDYDFADADGNTERWDVGYIANTDGTAAGTEGGSADINTTTAGKARVSVDPDATPTQAAYALKRDTPFYSRYYAVVADANTSLDSSQASSTFAGLRISAGDVDDASNYITIAKETSNAVDRITARAEFAGAAQITANFSTADTAVAFKIERYGNVYNVFYSLTQYPNWQWVKLTQFEDANGDMTSQTSAYLYTESAGDVDAQTAIADFDNFKYYINVGALDQLLSTSVLGSGTFTTSSATVPADTGRAEEDNYWNGILLMPITGGVAFQPRLVVDFANAGGVFTIDTDHPFTTAPSIGDEYVILAYQGDLVPAADAANNQTAMAVVGNKTDAIPAMNAVPGNDSTVAHLKAILERVGVTPADPDDSVLTNLGQRDDTATADDLSDITTTSIEAKLRRLLLRFSPDAFSATVQGGARTDVETMVQQLANYLASAGAAWSVTANPGGSAKDNLEETLEDFADMLVGATGISTFPVAAVAGDGVSFAEVLRHAAEAVGEDTANNAFDSSNVASNRDGSVLERLENLLDALGTDGTTPIDSATNLQGSIGVNDADNAFDSTSIVANRDGSVLERLEDVRDEIDDTVKVQEIIIYPVAEDLGTTELSDDGISPAYMPAASDSTTANAEGSPGVAWTEDIDFEQEGTITVIGMYAEFEWQTRFLVGGGAGTQSSSKIQISNDAGGSWVDLTDNFDNVAASMTNRIRAGVGRWITSVTAGVNQLAFRLVHWTDDGGSVSTSEAQVRSNSYVRITYRKS